jgi:ATP-dependent RNA helicase RhlE
MTSSTFAALGLAQPLLRVLETMGFATPTPIQLAAVPPLLAGRDLLGTAPTGSGKTVAFGLPLLQSLAHNRARSAPYATRALILTPTRELATQIDDNLRALAAGQRLRSVTILGGVSRSRQVERMRGGTDIVIGTPGRICDLLSAGQLRLGAVSCFILDEADRMLDLGFIRDIRRIVAALPATRQSAMFSATMPAEVGKLTETLLRDPVRVAIAQVAATIPRIDQHVHFVHQAGKRSLLGRLLQDPALSRVIVFTRTKHGAERVAAELDRDGVMVDALHGNKSQPAREKALDRFRRGRTRVLVATDLASRGIDVTGISHVINFDLPAEAENYVHRIGRTARAGAAGVAISFCDAAEYGALRAIERISGAQIALAGGVPPTEPVAASRRPAGRPASAEPRRRRGRTYRPDRLRAAV